MVELNKKHLFKIILKQQQSMILKFCIFPLPFKVDEFYVIYIIKNKNEIIDIFNQTVGQSESDIWKKERFNRS